MPGPEVAEVPALVEVLGAATLFVAWAVLYGTRWGYQRSFKWLILQLAHLIDVSVLGRHPLGGVANWLRAQARNIDTLLARGIVASERGAVVLFKLFLNTQLWIASEIANLATDTWHAIRGASDTIVKPAIRVLDTKTQALVRRINASVGTLTHVTVPALRARVHALDARVAHLEHALPHGISHPIPSLERLLRDRGRTRQRLHEIEKKLTVLGVAGLMVAALSRMGLSWLRCPALSRIGRKIGCGGFSWLEGFLATTFEALVVLDLCRFALAAQQLAKLLVPQLAGTLLVQNAVCLGGGASLPSAHDSPKVSTRLVLPSAHD